MHNSTLCYVIRGDQVLMLHRVKKKNDVNKDKWIGIGGKFDFPSTVCLLFQAVCLFFFPIVESSYQKDLSCMGCPFTKNPVSVGALQTKVQISGCKVR